MIPLKPQVRTCRSGIAPIEFALCLPILLTLSLAIVWLGASMIGQSEVTVEARDLAWKQRFDNASGTPLVFVSDAGDLVSETASTTVEVMPILDGVSPPESKHDVLAGAWDHRSMMADDGPHWSLYALAAANAKTAGLQNAYVDASNQLSQVQNLGNQLLSQSLAEAAAKLTGIGDFESATGAAENAANDRSEVERANALANVARLRAEIATTTGEIRQSELEANQESDELKKKSLELQLTLLKAKRKRLRVELAANQRIAAAL